MKLVKMADVILKAGNSRSVIYRLIAKGEFPAPVKTSTRSIAFVEEEIDDWIAARIAARDAARYGTANAAAALS